MPKAGQPPGLAFLRPWSTVWLGLGALALVIGSHPLTWGRPMPGLWNPAAGVGLVLIAWFGFRATLLIFLATLLTASHALLHYPHLLPANGAGGWPMVCLDALLSAAELHLAWWCYHHLGRGARELTDPKSAMLYLIVVPGAIMATTAALRAGLLEVAAPGVSSFSAWFAPFWLNRALGLLILTPPLLSMVTPWLARRRWIIPEVIDESQIAQRGHLESAGLTRGDWIEILGLAFGASVLALLLFWINYRQEAGGWQLWGLPLLLIVWASIRQGVRGGTFVAGTSAALPLLALLGEPTSHQVQLLQGNLLAQCGTALLVSASATWLKASELRYRHVVSHSPVLIYSAHILAGPANRAERAALPGPSFVAKEGRRLPAPIRAEITLVSSASVALMGCSPDHLLGEHHHWLQHVHAEDREVVQAAMVQLTRQKQPVTCEYRLADGQEDPETGVSAVSPAPKRPRLRWVRDTMAPHFDTDGRLIGWEGVVMEITEQRYLADDLRRTTSMFQTLVSHLPTGVFFVHGALGRPILVNARARQLLGQREDVSVSMEYLSEAYRLFNKAGELYPIEDLPVFQALRHGRTTMRDDIVVHRPDGRRIPLVTWAAPVTLGRTDQPDAAVWVLEDLTALHQAEAARRDTEGRLRTVIETMGEGVVVQDRKGCVLESNPAACSLLMHQPQTLRGQSLFNLGWVWLQEDGTPLPEEDHPTNAVLRVGRPVRNVVLGMQFQGSDRSVPITRWLLVNSMPLGSPSPSGVVTTFSDVTAYRHAQEVVRLSEEKYRGLIESLPLMVIQTDASRHVHYSNPATRATTGYDEAALAEPSFWDTFLLPDEQDNFRGLVAQALAGQAGRAELRYRARDGSERVAYAMSQPFLSEGGATILMVDITRERRLEEDLQRAQRLEMIGRLSSGIAHDFNNLLTVVMGLTDLVRASLPEGHLAHTDLQRITEATEQAASLASQLLTLSRTRRPTTRRVEVNEVARRTLEMLRPTLPTGIHLDAQLGPDALYIQAEETQVQQVLMNLCLNARDAITAAPVAGHPERGSKIEGEIRVRTAVVNHRSHGQGNYLPSAPQGVREGHWVHLSVADTGQGMSEQVKARIFDPFFSTKEHGTGLGLAVVQQIVESCGGQVEVRSNPGRGSSFEVWLPLLSND